MKDKYYKTRREAEQNRKKGDSVYFVSNKGYYLIPNKDKKYDFKSRIIKHIITLMFGMMFLFFCGLIFFIGAAVGYNNGVNELGISNNFNDSKDLQKTIERIYTRLDVEKMKSEMVFELMDESEACKINLAIAIERFKYNGDVEDLILK